MKNDQINSKQCLTKICELQANYKWNLISAEYLAKTVEKKMDSEPTLELQPTIIATYAAEALYPALIGQQGTAQQNQAAREVALFLHRVLCKRWPSLVESSSDIIQATLERILRQIETCRRPETVLAFAATKLRTVVQKEFRQLAREQKFDSIDALNEQGKEFPLPKESDSALSIEGLGDQIRHYQQHHPKAAKQLEAVYLRYCEGYTVEETAVRLGMTHRNVSVLTSRGLKFLRERKDDFIA